MCFGRVREQVVAKADVQGQPRGHLPVVLREIAGLPSAGVVRDRGRNIVLGHETVKQFGNRVAGGNAVSELEEAFAAVVGLEEVDVAMDDVGTELEVVVAANPGDVVCQPSWNSRSISEIPSKPSSFAAFVLQNLCLQVAPHVKHDL